MDEKVDYPLFELVGPPCEDEKCDGVLEQTYFFKTQEMGERCSKCNNIYNLMPAAEKVGWVVRTIDFALT